MAKDPAFLFYSQDFFTGTSTLSFEDRGKYITILCLMHQQGRLDEETICLLVGSFSVKLKSKFNVDNNGLFYNKRLEFEVERRNNYTESRRNNGLGGGRPKKDEKPYANHTNNHTNNHTPHHIENDNDNVNTDVIIDNSVLNNIHSVGFEKKEEILNLEKIGDETRERNLISQKGYENLSEEKKQLLQQMILGDKTFVKIDDEILNSGIIKFKNKELYLHKRKNATKIEDEFYYSNDIKFYSILDITIFLLDDIQYLNEVKRRINTTEDAVAKAWIVFVISHIRSEEDRGPILEIKRRIKYCWDKPQIGGVFKERSIYKNRKQYGTN